MADDFEPDTGDLQRRMDGAMANLRTEFASLRTGRASASMLEPVQVDAYGQMTPINQVGTVNVPESRMIAVQVWDKGTVGAVEKAIRGMLPKNSLGAAQLKKLKVYRGAEHPHGAYRASSAWPCTPYGG